MAETGLPLEDFNNEQRFVVWSIRTWVRCYKTESCPINALWHRFQAAGCLAGLSDFQRWLRTVAACTRQPLDVRCPRCPKVSEDEQALLGAVEALGAERGATAHAMLRRYFSAPALPHVLLPAARFAAVMTAAAPLGEQALDVVRPAPVLTPEAPPAGTLLN